MKKRTTAPVASVLIIAVLVVFLLFGFWRGFARAKTRYQVTDSHFVRTDLIDSQFVITGVSGPDEHGETVICATELETELNYAFRVMPDSIYFEGNPPLDTLTAGTVAHVYTTYHHLMDSIHFKGSYEAICRYITISPVDAV